MKNSIFLSSLLAVCVACVAQAEDSYKAFYMDSNSSGPKTVEGDLNVNFLNLNINVGTVKVTGTTTIDSELDKAKVNESATKIQNIRDNTEVPVYYYNQLKGDWRYYNNQVLAGSTFESKNIIFNGPTTAGPQKFLIKGTVKTDSFIVNATAECPVILNISSGTTSGRLESFTPGEQGTLVINENVVLEAGTQGYGGKYNDEITLNTVINGGTANLLDCVTVGNITLNSGEINFAYAHATQQGDAGIAVGDLTVESGTLNIKENISTGALTLNNCTINFSDGAVIDLGGNDLTLGDNVAITLSVESLENIEGLTLFQTTGNVEGFEELTVTFVEETTGTRKDAKLSISNDGTVITTTTVPEPTTATLSLLALCGLAARRRRK